MYPSDSTCEQKNDFWKASELECVEVCPGCGSRNSSIRFSRLDDLLQHVPGVWSLDECGECHSLRLNPRPDRSAINKAYQSDYVTHTSAIEAHQRDNGVSLIWRLCNGYLNHRYRCKRQPASVWGRYVLPVLWPIRQQLDYFYRHLSGRSGRILDIGCGNGAFLLRAKDAGWEVEGLEPDPVAMAMANDAGLAVHSIGPEEFYPEHRFDRVTLSHVIEHLHEPRDVLAHCHRLLETGGELWLSLPNIAGIGLRLYGRNWVALDPPRHLFLPRAVILKRMLEEAGFREVQFVRRGCGARNALLPSDRYAGIRGARQHWVNAWVSLVDVVASLFSTAAEELVVISRKK